MRKRAEEHNAAIRRLLLSAKKDDAVEPVLQAGEEFEATNEELQATNEELETNNEELQATNEKLQTTNDELVARTAELQELTLHQELEQTQLSHLLQSFPHYVMVLNAEDLTIQAVNPGYQQWVKPEELIGFPVTEVFNGEDVDQFLKLLLTAIREKKSIHTLPVQASALRNKTADGRFVHTVVPITDAPSANVNRLFIYSERVE